MHILEDIGYYGYISRLINTGLVPHSGIPLEQNIRLFELKKVFAAAREASKKLAGGKLIGVCERNR
jgi:hypothetical protein